MYIKRREKEENPYSRLQQQSLEMLQKLSGKRWTDFNEHDPGVTIVDILNYNLLELHYQTGFDFEKYLTPPSEDKLKFSQVGLLPGHELFAPCIVTPYDYEELIKKQIEDVKECEVKMLSGNRYQIFIDIKNQEQAVQIIQKVENLYHRCRNLCENLEQVSLKKIRSKKYPRQFGQVKYLQENEKVQAQNAFATQQTSIQYDFPDTYGINRAGLPTSVSVQRQAQALQLKGYLFIFDYLLSATKQQLRNLHQALNLSGQAASPFSTDIDAGDTDLLIDDEKQKRTLLFKPSESDRQKSAYLDMLDALYGEDTSFLCNNPSLQKEEINRRRAKLIRRFPSLNTNRFRAFDMKDRSLQSMPGIKKIMQAIWHNNLPSEITLENLFSHYKLRLINDEILHWGNNTVFSEFFYHIHIHEEENTDNTAELVPVVHLLPEQKKYGLLKKRLHFFSNNLLLQSLLTNGENPERYRMKHTGSKENVMLLYKQPSAGQWLNIGFFDNAEILIQTANILWNFLKMLNNRCTMFYVVENLLLQSPDEISDEECNILYLIFPAWRESFYQKNNYLEHLQERLPIHIESWVIWLSFEEFYHFEQSYISWRRALATGNTEQVTAYAEKLRNLIEVNNEK